MRTLGISGWDQLRHGGMLLDAVRLNDIAQYEPDRLEKRSEDELRRRVAITLDAGEHVSDFVSYVLRDICGFRETNGSWMRGSDVSSDWGRKAVTGEIVKPRHVWIGKHGGRLPIFIEKEKRLGVGRGRRLFSRTVGWLRAGQEHLAVITNGRQWRLVFAGLDFDAWCEWDVDLWFDEGGYSEQVSAFRTLLQPVLWDPPNAEDDQLLLRAIRDSRKGQADLSKSLGERVREAVETLIDSHGDVLRDRCGEKETSEIYRAAARIVMRLVVVLFAESRELLPADNAVYYGQYGLAGLRDHLERMNVRGAGRLARSFSAWPRILALFRLIYSGSHHPDLPMPAYGGELFAPGNKDAEGILQRAIATFETACFEQQIMSDRQVYDLIDKITRTTIRLRQGRSSIRVNAPVDFSDLSSEYVGILYEGLLDFELRMAPPGDPVIFLSIGNQPALPLSRLEQMDDSALKKLFENMKKDATPDDTDEETAEAEDESVDQNEESDDGEESAEEENTDKYEYDEDARRSVRSRAESWARSAVIAGKLARKPRGRMTPEKKLVYEEAIGKKAKQLVSRVVLPGEWYLVRWGGTRKGSGSFYTRPGLAVPTVQRTLRPLVYDVPVDEPGESITTTAQSESIPKPPEEILSLQVVDPACGSGTFPVAALRYLTDGLYASLNHHGRISEHAGRSVVSLIEDRSENDQKEAKLGEELIPCRPDDQDFESRMKAVLRRHVVERCIYGVDLDPLAVELCRLSLWIETMDRSLPFSFLDHKIKCGNALIGAWFDTFQHYPVMAWKNREGGDKNHKNGVHYKKEERTKAIKSFVRERMTPDLVDVLLGQRELFEKKKTSPEHVHDDALMLLERLHELPVHEAAERARLYKEEIVGSESWLSLKEAMDLWCACWFWPDDELDAAPLPSSIHAPSPETKSVAARIARENRFFHWELEYPDVFRAEKQGFDAVLGNPPWNISKPISKEFFSNIDPLYRGYGNQEAERYQTDYFADASVEEEWIEYNAHFRSVANFVKYAANAFGDPDRADNSVNRFALSRGKKNKQLHDRWRVRRSSSEGFVDMGHPYQHQGSADINVYKLFLEHAHSLLRTGGRMGMIVPSGLYSDKGTQALRELFVSHCRWEWLFGFENKEKIFDIHRSYKFNPVVIEKGIHTNEIRSAFMRHHLEDWERAEEFAIPYSREQVDRFSPRSKALLEIQSPRDLELLEKIYEHSVLLGEEGPDGWGVRYATEFHMKNDSKLFPPRPKWEAKGYHPDEYSRWLKGKWRPTEELWAEFGINTLPEGEKRCAQPPYDRIPIPRADIPAGIILSREADAWIKDTAIEDKSLPLFQGAMISRMNPFSGRHISGIGQKAKWDRAPNEWGIVQPQYLIRESVLSGSSKYTHLPKIAYRRVARTTDERTMIPSAVAEWPAGDSLFFYYSEKDPLIKALILATIFGSFSYDFQMRLRLGGTNLSDFVVSETAVPCKSDIDNIVPCIFPLASSLSLYSAVTAHLWCKLPQRNKNIWRKLWAIMPAERLRIDLIINAIVAVLYALNVDDMYYLLRDADLPVGGNASSGRENPIGFWRTDKQKPPELRQTVLTLIAFQDLQKKIEECGGDREKGISAFCEQNDGEGWMLPESLRLADYGLGHDERSKEHQPVASRFGPRFYDWQLAQSQEESWKECHLHARNLMGEDGYGQLLKDIEEGRNDEEYSPKPDESSSGRAAEGPGDEKQGRLI